MKVLSLALTAAFAMFIGTSTSFAGDCRHIPDCLKNINGSDGIEIQKWVSVASARTIWLKSNPNDPTFYLTYNENPASGIQFCEIGSWSPEQLQNLYAVFIVGEGDQAKTYRHRLTVKCPFPDYRNQQKAYATFSMSPSTNPEAWNQIFPANAAGERWFAVQVAFVTEDGRWDSNFGNNYRIILE